MATGIVSIAAWLLGLERVGLGLFGLNLIAYGGLWGILLWRLLTAPAAVTADLSREARAPGLLTIVAGTCVLGNQIALFTAHPLAAALVWCAGLVLWIGLVYWFFLVMTIRPVGRPLDPDIDGSWLLVVVATQALAILTSRVGDMIALQQPIVFGTLCLFLLGAAFYVVLLIMIVYRWFFSLMRPSEMLPPYWINMGAAAITALAGTRVLATMADGGATAPAGEFVFTATILFWAIATWWIPLLALLTLWHYRSDAVRLSYRVENWSMVFPLGMYATATWHLAHEFRLPFLDALPWVFFALALLAWCLTFAGMVRHAAHGDRRQIDRPAGG